MGRAKGTGRRGRRCVRSAQRQLRGKRREVAVGLRMRVRPRRVWRVRIHSVVGLSSVGRSSCWIQHVGYSWAAWILEDPELDSPKAARERLNVVVPISQTHRNMRHQRLSGGMNPQEERYRKRKENGIDKLNWLLKRPEYVGNIILQVVRGRKS